ncbi:restriction endonuclease subunit S [Halomonas sp. PAR8]|uniref:restriction endonuclease subunit S n=1 Tax=Halomonas sp. PAR8 TaxID=3075515 RepID=UPI0028858548|nr:restriction endonuclease subunit S [Halomonas sp. PAR8]MDT0593169.1 restriction endonuclease subunit S [Halomonas sp. PAR8]
MEQKKRVPKRRFAGFTDEWEDRKLGDIAEIVSGGTPSTNNPKYWDGDVDWYSPTEIGDHVYAYRSVKTITQLGLEKSSAKILPPAKTILFTSRAGIGDMAILQRPGATNQGFQSLVLKEGIDTYFIYSMGHLIKKYAEKNASGSTFLEISGKTLGNMLILVPSINEQQKIGDFFKKLDDMITIQQRKLEKTKALKSAYLAEMFPAEGERLPKRRFAGFTDEWEKWKLGNLAEIVRGASPRPIQEPKWFDKKSNIGWLRISDVTEQNGRINYLEQRLSKLGQEKTRVLNEPHLLLSIAATVGKPVVNYVKTGVHDGFLIFMNPKFDREFMFQWLEMFRPMWNKYGQPGSQINLNSEIVKGQIIVVPNLEEQKKIGAFFKSIDTMITNHHRKLEKLQALKQAYLHEMFV